MQVDLAGQVALVAGAETGLGAALTQALAGNGAKVDALKTADLPNEPDWCNLFEATIRRNGALDVLIDASALAGHMATSCESSTVVRRSDALIIAAGQLMVAQKGGRIVTLLSALGLLPTRGEHLLSAMHAALAATIRARAMELAPRGVIVNGLAVGAIGTDHPYLVSHVPIGRSGTKEEVAAAMLFLADPENTYTVGHILNVDGGWQAGYARDF